MTAPDGAALGALIASRLRDVPDFPQPGILFKDIMPLLADGQAFGACIDYLAELAAAREADLIAGIEARGFMVAAALARTLNAGVVAVRKAGKLPPPTVSARYDLEYGSAEIEVPVGVLEGKRVFVVDDVLATGGTLAASLDLLATAGATVSGVAVLIELEFLGGRSRLTGHDLTTLLRL
ncbi:adenine phosphoribosyltransferase [Jatrophihabitans sp.]|uniref:adenine phosphoribosyltransferase n=1 Tax=Jatrophihabitans sp. TaxID=1932789 RepID=UPI002BB3E85D|nr:adenine phosphoribosyltransferase [Jatrophihabitans sp.]